MDQSSEKAASILLANEEHFQIAMQAGRVMFWVASADGECELVSANWTGWTGQPPSEALGHGWLDAVEDCDRERVVETVRRAATARSGFQLRYRLRKDSGLSEWVLQDASPRFLPSGRFNGLIATLHDCGDTHAGELALQTSAQKVYDYVSGVALGAVSIDMQGSVVHCNKMLCTVLACSAADLLGTDWFGTQVAEEDREQVRRLINGEIPLSELPTEIEYSIGPAGASRLFRWHLTLIRDFDGRPASLTMMGSDITEWRRSGDSLRLTARVFETSNEAMLITDHDNKMISVNASFTRLTGYSADEARGQDPKILSSGRHDRDFYRQMWRDLKNKGFWRGDVWDRRKDGSLYPKYLAISTIRDESGTITHYSAIFHDVSERKALEAELDHLAHFDELTDLPNRALLQDRLEQAVAGAERRGQRFALLFVDLDGFKPVNDTYGHKVGDEILKLVAQRLRHAIRGMDTAARLGGDEFVIVLNDIGNAATAGQVAEKIAQGLSEPYKVGELTIGLSASIGISIFPHDEVCAQDLLRAADEAMYIAKRDGKSRVHFYHGNG